MTETILGVDVMYEDLDLLVLNKSAGIVVNRAASVKVATVQDWVEQNYPKLFAHPSQVENEAWQLFTQRSGMVHRLDKDTSGVLLWAKSPSVMLDLMKQFKERSIKKTYTALVHGWLNPTSGTIRVPLGRLQHNRKRFGVVVGGKMTETDYQVEQNYAANPKYPGGFCLVKLYPQTGRTHQLRVVLKHLQHPIVGDAHYVGKKRAKHDAKWCQRQFLHAQEITFNHPTQSKPLTFSAPLSQDLTEVLSTLELKV